MNINNYGKLCAIIYDLDNLYVTEEEIEVYSRLIESKKRQDIRTNVRFRQIFSLLKNSYNITVFDLSEDMLKCYNILKCVKK